MDKYVVSLDLSKKLKIAGWKKETEFWWVPIEKIVYRSLKKDDFTQQTSWELQSISEGLSNGCGISAPISDEILEELPKYIQPVYPDTSGYSFKINKNTLGYQVEYSNRASIPYFREDESLPNALAKMWLYLKKQGLLEDKNG